VHLRLEAHRLMIEIADNGSGFDVVAGEAKRSGLVHIRQRVEEIGGQCAFESSPRQGARVKLTVPLDRDGAGQ
jgi:signal transduction histidine kinase